MPQNNLAENAGLGAIVYKCVIVHKVSWVSTSQLGLIKIFISAKNMMKSSGLEP